MGLIFTILAIILGIFLLGTLVFVHEAGHFFTAKFFKIKVEEFGFGFPPRVWGKRRGETIYTINAIPAGGFVRLLGEDGEAAGDPRSFAAKGPWVRATVIAAGVIVNLIVAFLLFSILLAANNFRSDMPTDLPFGGKTLNLSFPFGQQTKGVLIDYVIPGSPAEKAGIKSLDEVVTADGQSFTSISAFQEFVKEREGRKIDFSFYNILDRQARQITATPRENPPEDEGALGVYLSNVATLRYESLPDKILVGPAHSVNMLYFQRQALGSLFTRAVQEKSAAPVASTVSGPIGIVALLGAFIGKTGTSGIFALLETLALLSLILAVINILPIPALDGGRFFFTLFEGVTHRKVNQNVERWVHTVGFTVLIVLLLLITFNDITKLFG
jgi:regulator of sigma E protease